MTGLFPPEYSTVIATGSFARDVQASSTYNAPANSQYKDMLIKEEKFHEEDQMENADHPRWGTAFIVANIITEAQSAQPYKAATAADSRNKAEAAFAAAEDNELHRSEIYLSQQSVRCADEKEAKGAAGSSHRLAMPSTYPDCN